MSRKLIFCIFLILLVTLDASEARKKKARKHKYEKTKQIYDTRETNTPNFVRLVIMRLIYGIAAQMGIEERLEGVFNGAFVPPNADDDDFFGFGSDEAEDGLGLDIL